MPTPSHMHFGQFKKAIDPNIYPDIELYWNDMVAVYQQELKDLYTAGCRYLQLDEVPLALLCDDNISALAKHEGDDPDKLISRYVDVLNRAISGRPDDMTIAMHLCRGNMESLWMGDGGYAPIAEVIFTRCDVDAYLLEYDTRRAGDFEPLRHLPANKRAYLGIISTKNPTLETPDELTRRIDDATRFAPIERLGICPQCGFASAAMSKFAVVPSKLTADIQTQKIQLLVEIGTRVWGHA
jgi:5-methyltetrahydropteroyltriglutamate--homocysteine methyltransferase